jgi:hypothetical protein
MPVVSVQNLFFGEFLVTQLSGRHPIPVWTEFKMPSLKLCKGVEEARRERCETGAMNAAALRGSPEVLQSSQCCFPTRP